MKNPFLIAGVIFALLLDACSEESTGIPELKLTSPEQMQIPADEGWYKIRFEIINPSEKGEVEAYVENGIDWITDIRPMQNSGQILFFAKKNDSEKGRDAKIFLNYENSCLETEINQAPGRQPDHYDMEFEANMITGFYYGDKYSPGTGDYWFFFTDKGFDNDLSALPNGTYYRVDLYAPLSDAEENIPIPEGCYTLDMSGTPSCEAYTFSQYSTFYTTNASGDIDISYPYDDGQLTVARNEDGTYRLDMIITTSDGLLRHVYYEGEVALKNDSAPNLPPSAGEFPAIGNNLNCDFYKCIPVFLGSGNGVSEVNIQFRSDMESDGNGGWIGPGALLDVHFYTTLNDKYQMAEGTYTCGRGSAGMFRPGGALDIGVWAVFGTYVTSIDDESVKTIGLVENGSVTVEKNDEIYSVTFDLIMQGGYSFTGSYTGPIEINVSGAGVLSTLTDDYTLDFTQGDIVATANYWGDFYETGTGNWTIDISPAPDSSQDDTFITDISCTGTRFGDDISGTYTASTNNEANTFMPGYISGPNIMGTMYLGGFDDNGYVTKLAPAMSGEVVIVKNTDGTHTISFDCFDDAINPHKFSGSWTGHLNMVDYSHTTSSLNLSAKHTDRFSVNAQEDAPTVCSYLPKLLPILSMHRQ